MRHEFLSKHFKEIDHLEELGVEGRHHLKCGRVWTGLVWLRIGNGGPSGNGDDHSGGKFVDWTNAYWILKSGKASAYRTFAILGFPVRNIAGTAAVIGISRRML
jgi:hypothetical protein